MNKFYYHSEGMDNNGNGGAVPSDDGWVIVECAGATYDDALPLLPSAAQQQITEWLTARNARTQSATTLQDAIDASCGMGTGFILMNEDEWQNALDAEDDDSCDVKVDDEE